MQREGLFALHKNLCEKALEIMRRKNADYCKAGPFDNFFVCETLNLTTAEKGVLIRMADKMSRLSTLMDNPPQVRDESFDDTIVDLINYAVILSALRLDREGVAKTSPKNITALGAPPANEG